MLLEGLGSWKGWKVRNIFRYSLFEIQHSKPNILHPKSLINNYFPLA
jgi:hypothetical protein